MGNNIIIGIENDFKECYNNIINVLGGNYERDYNWRKDCILSSNEEE